MSFKVTTKTYIKKDYAGKSLKIAYDSADSDGSRVTLHKTDRSFYSPSDSMYISEEQAKELYNLLGTFLREL